MRDRKMMFPSSRDTGPVFAQPSVRSGSSVNHGSHAMARESLFSANSNGENGSSFAKAPEDMDRAIHAMTRDLRKMISLSSRVMSPVPVLCPLASSAPLFAEKSLSDYPSITNNKTFSSISLIQFLKFSGIYAKLIQLVVVSPKARYCRDD